MDDVKPGWQTTEWWTTMAGKIAALVVALVALSGGKPEDQQALGAGSTAAVVGVGAIVAFAVLGWSYVRGRTAVKVAALK